ESLRKRRGEGACPPRPGLLPFGAPEGALVSGRDPPAPFGPERRPPPSVPAPGRELPPSRGCEAASYPRLPVPLLSPPQEARHRVSRLLRQLQCTLGGQQP